MTTKVKITNINGPSNVRVFVKNTEGKEMKFVREIILTKGAEAEEYIHKHQTLLIDEV